MKEGRDGNSGKTQFGRITNADSLKWFREIGSSKYKVISILARQIFGQFPSSGFQERTFTSAGGAMTQNQSRMSFEQLEQRTVLYQNREFMRQFSQV